MKNKFTLYSLLSLLGLLGCQMRYKLQVETVYSTPVSKTMTREDSQQTYLKVTHQAIQTPLAPNIELLENQNNTLKYELQFFVSSSGLSIQKVKQIRLEKQIVGDTLKVKHIVDIAGKAGKESNNVLGYNYRKQQNLGIPEDVKYLQVVLCEQREFSSTDPVKNVGPRVLTDKVFTVSSSKRSGEFSNEK